MLNCFVFYFKIKIILLSFFCKMQQYNLPLSLSFWYFSLRRNNFLYLRDRRQKIEYRERRGKVKAQLWWEEDFFMLLNRLTYCTEGRRRAKEKAYGKERNVEEGETREGGKRERGEGRLVNKKQFKLLMLYLILNFRERKGGNATKRFKKNLLNLFNVKR